MVSFPEKNKNKTYIKVKMKGRSKLHMSKSRRDLCHEYPFLGRNYFPCVKNIMFYIFNDIFNRKALSKFLKF